MPDHCEYCGTAEDEEVIFSCPFCGKEVDESEEE